MELSPSRRQSVVAWLMGFSFWVLYKQLGLRLLGFRLLGFRLLQ
jgi:hypothetical protein